MTTSNQEPPPVVAVVSSPSSNTELTLDIIDDQDTSRLVGALVGFDWNQSDPLNREDAPKAAVLGQITSMQMRNRWHEEAAFKNIVKTHKSLPAITAKQDTRTAIMKIGGCFVQRSGREYEHGDLGGVPATGTEIMVIRDKFLDHVLEFCEADLFYLGRAYGNNVSFPMWFKHFGHGNHGIGEAYHIGIFGKTGSGKTGLAKMLLAAYARHPDMGILVIDPQGEFTLEMRGNQVGGQQLNLADLMRTKLRRKVEVLPISKLRLDDWDLFRELLEASRFFELKLNIRGPDQRLAAETVAMRTLQTRFKIDQLPTHECVLAVLGALKFSAGDIYNTPGLANQLGDRIDDLTRNGFDDLIDRTWLPLTLPFQSGQDKKSVQEIIQGLVADKSGRKPIVVVDLSNQSGAQLWEDALQKRVISYIANSLVEEASKTLGNRERSANTLVVLDEAHRFVPSFVGNEPQTIRMRDEFRRAVRETRKYGVGWMFISQTMQGVDTEILTQLRAMFFGYGLSFGLEFQRLQQLAGGDREAMNLYRSFRDPQSAVNAQRKQFPFMAIGPISPMPFSGQSMFFTAYNAQDFLNENRWVPLQR